MFYECPKCKRRWEYSLAECPFCIIPLRKMESKTAKVSSVVKVAIPTLFHPNVPYYILLLEDEFGNMWGYKSEREYKVGDNFELKPNSDKDAVGIWRVKYDYGEAIAQVLGLIGDISVDADSKIVILPTLAAASHAYFRDNTSPSFLEAVLTMLLERGAQIKNITVASQSFDELPAAAAAQKSGLLEVCMKYKIMPTDLAAGEFERIGQFEISKAVLSADLVINLAAEKIGRAEACANLCKVLKKENYLGQKYLSSEKDIICSLEPILNKITVIGEAEYSQRSNKLTAFTGLVLAAKSSRNLDRVFNETAKSFKMPEAINDIPVSEIPIAGRSIKEVQYQAEIF